MPDDLLAELMAFAASRGPITARLVAREAPSRLRRAAGELIAAAEAAGLLERVAGATVDGRRARVAWRATERATIPAGPCDNSGGRATNPHACDSSQARATIPAASPAPKRWRPSPGQRETLRRMAEVAGVERYGIGHEAVQRVNGMSWPEPVKHGARGAAFLEIAQELVLERAAAARVVPLLRRGRR